MKILLTVVALGFPGLSFTARAADESVKPYALETCVYSGEKLGEMGKVLTETYNGQEMKFCCRSCQEQFDKEPEAGIKKYHDGVTPKSSGGASTVPGQ